MKERKLIEVTISSTGATSIDLKNFHGKGCKAIMEAMTAHADEITHELDKAEFHEPDPEMEITEKRMETL